MGIKDDFVDKQKKSGKKNNININYIQGCNRFQIKKFARFYFGDEKVVDIKEDLAARTYNLILTNEPEEWKVKRFKNFWTIKITVI